MLSLLGRDINNLEGQKDVTYWFTILIDVEKFFYIRGMDYIPTFKRGERFNDNYYEFVKGLGVELEKEGYIKEYIQNRGKSQKAMLHKYYHSI